MTLTQAAIWTRRGIVGAVVLVILGLSSAFGYNAWYKYQLENRPQVEEKPEVKFGALPELQFPSSSVSSSNFSYSIDTTTGGLPQTPKLGKVYFIPQAGISLLSPEKSQKLAENLGFTGTPETLSPTQYKFKDEKGGELLMDITTGNFSFQKPLPSASESGQLTSAPFSNKEQVISDFKNYLAGKNLLVDELQNGRTNVTFSDPSPNKSETAQASIWPSDFDNLPIVTASLGQGLVKATVTTSIEEKDKYQKVNYVYWPIDKTTSSTYPLRTADQALADLRFGKGFISLEPAAPQVSISSVYMAYFESESYSPYLQPVFVFEGPGFAAIVPAISSESSGKPNP